MAELIKLDERGIVTIRVSIRSLQIAAVAVPVAYMLLMMKVGAIKYPIWDHLDTAKQIVEYFDGTLTWTSLLEPQAQSRPLIPRLLFVVLAALTRWDIRAEFVLLCATLLGTIALLVAAAWRVTVGATLETRLLALLLTSLLACSPVGAQNQTWSLMLIATLCYLSTLAAFVLVSLYRTSWTANVAAAALAWIATYSMGQGLFIFPLVTAVHQIADRRWRPSLQTIFWLANMAACYALFLPGFPTGHQPSTLMHLIAFVFVYIGNPLGELLWYPYHGAVDLPWTLWINLVCGIAIAAAALFTAWQALRDADRPPALLFLQFAGYGAICALATAWGRAFGPLAVEGAQASRYSSFAACILFGLIFYHAGSLRIARKYGRALGVLLALCFLSYLRAVWTFEISGRENDWLGKAYPPGAAATEFDAKVYPDVGYFEKMKANLYRLRIGPYR